MTAESFYHMTFGILHIFYTNDATKARNFLKKRFKDSTHLQQEHISKSSFGRSYLLR